MKMKRVITYSTPSGSVEQRVIIFSAPSGSGKTTIVKRLLQQMDNLAFSISATTRAPRGSETDGCDYYFLTPQEFKRRIANNEFVEWEEVYQNKFYGTLYAELERLWQQGKQVIFDVDVYGGLSLKKKFGEQALLVFIMPPSIEALRERLVGRATETPEIIAERVAKAQHEMTFSSQFDVVIINDELEKAIVDTRAAMQKFLLD
ncbi:guanylate kinase [Bacteroidia bacterium]|nr:guanylate kinase [Bacteroidia bacterium]